MADNNTKQRLIWIEESDRLPHQGDPWFHRTTKPDNDVIITLEEMLVMAKEGKITGVATVASTPAGSYHMAIAGESYERPYSAIAGISRLKKISECLLPEICTDEEED